MVDSAGVPHSSRLPGATGGLVALYGKVGK